MLESRVEGSDGRLFVLRFVHGKTFIGRGILARPAFGDFRMLRPQEPALFFRLKWHLLYLCGANGVVVPFYFKEYPPCHFARG